MLVRPHFNKKAMGDGTHLHCNLSCVGGQGRKIEVSIQSQRKCKILSVKWTKAKRAGFMAQMVEDRPSNSKALNSNPSTTKKKKKD
jgi:hypothetical protein